MAPKDGIAVKDIPPANKQPIGQTFEIARSLVGKTNPIYRFSRWPEDEWEAAHNHGEYLKRKVHKHLTPVEKDQGLTFHIKRRANHLYVWLGPTNEDTMEEVNE